MLVIGDNVGETVGWRVGSNEDGDPLTNGTPVAGIFVGSGEGSLVGTADRGVSTGLSDGKAVSGTSDGLMVG